ARSSRRSCSPTSSCPGWTAPSSPGASASSCRTRYSSPSRASANRPTASAPARQASTTTSSSRWSPATSANSSRRWRLPVRSDGSPRLGGQVQLRVGAPVEGVQELADRRGQDGLVPAAAAVAQADLAGLDEVHRGDHAQLALEVADDGVEEPRGVPHALDARRPERGGHRVGSAAEPLKELVELRSLRHERLLANTKRAVVGLASAALTVPN